MTLQARRGEAVGALSSLSRDHHQALVVARKRFAARDATPEDARASFPTYWTSRGERRFRLEEKLLFPAYAGAGALSHKPAGTRDALQFPI